MSCCECDPDVIYKNIDEYPYIQFGLKGEELEAYFKFYKGKTCPYCNSKYDEQAQIKLDEN